MGIGLPDSILDLQGLGYIRECSINFLQNGRNRRGDSIVSTNAGYENVENNIGYSLKWCSISLTDVISRGKRLGANVYDIEAKQARQLIKSGKYPLTTIGGINGLASSYTGARFKHIWVEKSDLPIYQLKQHTF